MKIAQVAPLFERVPPKYYGGTERIVAYLTDELVRQGQDVTLFASGDSVTAASLASVCEEGLRLNAKYTDHILYHILSVEQVARRDQPRGRGTNPQTQCRSGTPCHGTNCATRSRK